MQTLQQRNDRGWSRRRWGWTALAVFAAQVGLILALSPHSASKPAGSRIEPNFRLVVGKISETEVLNTFFVNDPRLFVLPDGNGFSGEAWIDGRKIEYEMPEWNEPPSWMTFNPEWLGGAMREFIQTNSASTLPLSQKLPPREESALRAYPDIVDIRPAVRIEGEIAVRTKRLPSDVITWTNSEPLLDTIVNVAINGAGEIVSSRLSPSTRSGLRLADEKAIEMAREIRFEPVNSGSAATNISTGRLIFHWRTVPPINTMSSVSSGGGTR